MHLWIDKEHQPQRQWIRQWTWVPNVGLAIYMIKNMAQTNPVTLISVQLEQAEELLEKLHLLGGNYNVVVRGPTSARAAQLIAQHHWDRKVMDKRTAEIIMVLKGNHNLEDNTPKDYPCLPSYLNELALYLSDDCMCPFQYYVHHVDCLERVVHEAVVDYMKACDTPAFLVWEYFDIKNRMTDIFNDTQCWCAALANTIVRDNHQYVNGWSDYHTQSYQRQRPFILN